MLDMSVIFDSTEYGDKGTESSMFLSEPTDREMKLAVVALDSFICGGKEGKTELKPNYKYLLYLSFTPLYTTV